MSFKAYGMNTNKNTPLAVSSQAAPSAPFEEVRCAVRFPLTLPVMISNGREEFAAVTRNVSASGVLFEMDRPLNPGMEIRFSLRMPAAVLGMSRDVMVHCAGRVVRCCLNQSQHQAAATIDDYRFAEQ